MLEFIGGEVPQICYATVGVGSKVIVTDIYKGEGGGGDWTGIKTTNIALPNGCSLLFFYQEKVNLVYTFL